MTKPTQPALTAQLAIWTSATFLILVGLLHFLKPEFDPSWRMISEYAIGDFGWLMKAAFFALSLSCISLVATLWTSLSTKLSRVALCLLCVTAVGLMIAGIFTTDPITITRDQVTPQGNLHGLGFYLGVPTLPIAATLLVVSIRKNTTWNAARKAVTWTTALLWLSIAAFGLVMALTFKGAFGPDVLIGWPNRIMIALYAIWLIVIARQATKVASKNN